MFSLFEPFRAAGYPRPKLVVTECEVGVAVWGPTKPWFSIPRRALKQCREFVIYYMAHELAHHAFGGLGHGERMAKVERYLLARFGLRVRYWGLVAPSKRWYARTVVRRSTGRAICNERGWEIKHAIPS